ncbi:hypothetical protein P9112_000563 [Eukaryota sp. TZLM1-RC]
MTSSVHPNPTRDIYLIHDTCLSLIALRHGLSLAEPLTKLKHINKSISTWSPCGTRLAILYNSSSCLLKLIIYNIDTSFITSDLPLHTITDLPSSIQWRQNYLILYYTTYAYITTLHGIILSQAPLTPSITPSSRDQDIILKSSEIFSFLTSYLNLLNNLSEFQHKLSSLTSKLSLPDNEWIHHFCVHGRLLPFDQSNCGLLAKILEIIDSFIDGVIISDLYSFSLFSCGFSDNNLNRIVLNLFKKFEIRKIVAELVDNARLFREKVSKILSFLTALIAIKVDDVGQVSGTFEGNSEELSVGVRHLVAFDYTKPSFLIDFLSIFKKIEQELSMCMSELGSKSTVDPLFQNFDTIPVISSSNSDVSCFFSSNFVKLTNTDNETFEVASSTPPNSVFLDEEFIYLLFKYHMSIFTLDCEYYSELKYPENYQFASASTRSTLLLKHLKSNEFFVWDFSEFI